MKTMIKLNWIDIGKSAIKDSTRYIESYRTRCSLDWDPGIDVSAVPFGPTPWDAMRPSQSFRRSCGAHDH